MAGIRKKLKAIKKRLCRLVSKTPKRKFYYGFFSEYCRLRPKWVLIESFHGQTVSDSGSYWRRELPVCILGNIGCSMPQKIKRSTKPLWTRRDCKWSWWM